jgi:hypothetical protein
MSSADEEAREFVTQNRQLLEDVLRFSQNPYARACALVLLKHGGTEREVDAIQDDLTSLREEIEG